jgi:hypothetical protein
MAVATPSRESTELIAEIMAVLEQLPQEDQTRFREAMMAAITEALERKRYRIVADALQAWQHLVLARRDPNYEKNMARGEEPLGPTFTFEEIKQRFQAPPTG